MGAPGTGQETAPTVPFTPRLRLSPVPKTAPVIAVVAGDDCLRGCDHHDHHDERKSSVGVTTMTNANRPYASTEPREHKHTDRRRPRERQSNGRSSREHGENAQSDGDAGENRGGATVGPPGKLRRARNTAPESASDELAQAVGMRAWRSDRDPADIWRELDESAPKEASGANHKCPDCDGFLAATEYDDVYRCDDCGRLCYEVTA